MAIIHLETVEAEVKCRSGKIDEGGTVGGVAQAEKTGDR